MNDTNSQSASPGLSPEDISSMRTAAGFSATPASKPSGLGTSLSDTLKQSASKYDQARAPVTPAAPARTDAFGRTLTNNDPFKDETMNKITDIPVESVSKTLDTYSQLPSKIGEDITAGAEDMQKGDIFKGIAKSGLRTAADVAGAIYAPISSAVGTIFDKLGINDAIAHSSLVDALSNQKWLQDFAMNHPNAGEDFNRALTLAMSGNETGEIDPKSVVSEVKGYLGKATDMAKNAPEPIDTADSIVKEGDQISPEQAQRSSWNDIQPKETPTTKLAYAKAGNVSEQGLFKPGELKPSPADNRLIDTQSKLYQDGTLNDNMSPNEKQAAINQKAAQLHSDQTNFLKDNDKAVSLTSTDVKGNSIGIFDKLDSIAKESSLPFSKDVSAKGAYDSAIDTFKSKLESGKSAGTTKGATTLSKLSDALTSFDKTMKSFGAYKKSVTGEISDTALARQNAIRDIHTTVRDFIAEELPPNSPWKSIRDQESRLYEISDRISQRIADTVGQSKATQTIKEHPIIKTGVKAAGLGVGLHLIP